MRTRLLILGGLIGFLLALSLSWVWARPAVTGGGGSSATWSWEDMQAMHESPAMRRMHERMPEDLQASCDEMHAQMGSMMTGGGMMTGGMGGMMDSGWREAGSMGPGMMGP